jgi:hypothetical protein
MNSIQNHKYYTIVNLERENEFIRAVSQFRVITVFTVFLLLTDSEEFEDTKGVIRIRISKMNR